MITINNFNLSFSEFTLSVPSLKTPDNGLVFLKGTNGSGKSSLFKCICGFIRSYSGDICFDNQNINHIPSFERIKKISFLPQISTLLPAISGQEYINQGLYLSGEDQSHHLIEQTNTKHLLHKSCHTLSGGQKQLLTFIRNLAIKKQIILLDEPDSFLSKSNKEKLTEIICQLSENHLILLSSHQEELYQPDRTIYFEETSDYHFRAYLL